MWELPYPFPGVKFSEDTRGGDVLYTNSTLALNADTGEIEWYFQYIPGGNWDLDHPFERIIVESEVIPDAVLSTGSIRISSPMKVEN